jgi:carboxylesterase
MNNPALRTASLVTLRQTTPAVPAPSAAGSVFPRALDLPGGRHGVLLFHGLSSTPLELQYLARGLHRAGHTVRVAVIGGYTHNLPGGQPEGHIGWARAALAGFDEMRQQCDTLAVGGLCIGALLALYVAGQRGAAVSHVLSLSTTLRYDGWAAPRARRLLPLARVLPWAGRIAVRERTPFGLKDERLRAWIAAQMRESGGSDAGAATLRVRDLLQAQNLMRLVRRNLGRIVAPTLLIHARDDDAASPRSAREVARSVSSRHVHLVILNDSYHMISIDQEKARVLAEMKDFLQYAPPRADTLAPTATPPSCP